MFFQLNCADVIFASEADDTSQSNDADVYMDVFSDSGAEQESECDAVRICSEIADCKKTTCMAILGWHELARVRQDPHFVTLFFQLNCADSILFSETDDTSQSNDADVEADFFSEAEAYQGSECVAFKSLSELAGFEVWFSSAMDGNSGGA